MKIKTQTKVAVLLSHYYLSCEHDHSRLLSQKIMLTNVDYDLGRGKSLIKYIFIATLVAVWFIQSRKLIATKVTVLLLLMNILAATKVAFIISQLQFLGLINNCDQDAVNSLGVIGSKCD